MTVHGAPASFVAEAGDGKRDAVRRTSPLAADLGIQCGPFVVPAGVAAVPGHAENDPGEEGDALRAFLDDNPWEGMGSVTRDRWLLLARNADTLVFGQRNRPVGIGGVVTLEFVNGRFAPKYLGGNRLALASPDERVGFVYGAATHGATLTLTWDCGQDLRHIPDRIVARVEVLEMPAAVHFLLVSAPNPDRPEVASGWQTGTGRTATASAELDRPLAERTLYNDGRIPAYPVDVQLA